MTDLAEWQVFMGLVEDVHEGMALSLSARSSHQLLCLRILKHDHCMALKGVSGKVVLGIFVTIVTGGGQHGVYASA